MVHIRDMQRGPEEREREDVSMHTRIPRRRMSEQLDAFIHRNSKFYKKEIVA